MDFSLLIAGHIAGHLADLKALLLMKELHESGVIDRGAYKAFLKKAFLELEKELKKEEEP